MINAFALPMCDRSCAVVLPQGDQTDKKKQKTKNDSSTVSTVSTVLELGCTFPAVHSSKKVMDEVVKFRSQLVSASVLAVSIL